jgi:hypothetical protein
MKHLTIVVLVVLLFVVSALPAFACGPGDNWSCEARQAAAGWQKAGQAAKAAGGWAVGQARQSLRQSQNAKGGPWVLPSGASKPLQGGYDAAGRLIKSHSR